MDSHNPPPPIPVRAARSRAPLVRRGIQSVSVPRRFGIAALIVVTLAFGGLFTCFRLLGISLDLIAFWSGLIVLVALGQAVIGKGRRPRLASGLVGAIYVPAVTFLVSLFNAPDGDIRFLSIPVWIVCGSSTGFILGYLVGTLASGVFLITRRWTIPDERPATVETTFDGTPHE